MFVMALCLLMPYSVLEEMKRFYHSLRVFYDAVLHTGQLLTLSADRTFQKRPIKHALVC